MPCKFCDFIEGRQTHHRKGYPFLILHETKRTVSFLSENIPKGKDSHILIIPKRHYADITKIPAKTLSELIHHVALASKIVESRHGGCNILLNNGKSAGQSIFHCHFHVIPRDRQDRIRIEVWKRSKIPLRSFLRLHKDIEQAFRRVTFK